MTEKVKMWLKKTEMIPKNVDLTTKRYTKTMYELPKTMLRSNIMLPE